MPLRLIPAILLLLIALGISVRNSRYGLYLVVLSVFFNPGSFVWLLDSFHIPLLLALSTLVAAIKEGKLSAMDRPLPVQDRLFILMLFFLALSAAAGEFHARTFPMLENWIKLFVMYSLILRVLREEEHVRQLWFLVLMAIAILATRGMIHYLQGWDEITGLPHSTMEDRNDFALVLAMSMPFAYFFHRTGKGLASVAFFSLHGLIIAVLLVTHSRMGFLLVCGYFGILFLQSRRKLAFLVVMIPLVYIALSVAPRSLVDRFETISNYEEDESSMGRIHAWNAGMKMMKDRPVTGVGLNSFEIPKIYNHYAEEVPRVAHNAYIQLGAEAGIPALVLFLAIIFTSGWKVYRLRASSTDEKERNFCEAMLVSLILYCAGSMFLSAEDRESFYILVGSIGAISIIRTGKTGLSVMRIAE